MSRKVPECMRWLYHGGRANGERSDPAAFADQASAYWQAQKKPAQACPGGHVPPQSPRIPPHVNPSVVEVDDDVDVVVDSTTSVELVVVEVLLVVVELLLVVDVSTVVLVLVDDGVADVLEVEPAAGGSVLLVVVGLAAVVVVVLVAGARVVDGRLVVVVTAAGYGSGHADGAGAFRAAKRPGASFLTLPPKSAHQRRGPAVSTIASAPCDGSSSVIPRRSARMPMPRPSRRTTDRTSEPAPDDAGLVKR
jgi:hypothetical protein